MKPCTRFTPKKRLRFLEHLKNTANVTLSARLVGVSRRTVYNHRAADPGFASAWDTAVDEAIDLLEAEARRRAVDGTDRPVYQGGELVGYVRGYSDTLLIFLLKGHRPEKYRERHHVNVDNNGPIEVRWNNLDHVLNDNLS